MKMQQLFLLMITLLPSTLLAQNFELIGDSPFGIQIINTVDSSRYAYKSIFFDGDGDKDLDLYHFGFEAFDTVPNTVSELSYFIEYQENTGNKWNPEFALREKNVEDFPFPSGNNFFIPTCGDLNGDQKMDFVICSEVDSFFQQFPLFYLSDEDDSFNISNCSNFNLPPFPPNSITFPTLTDLDSDGDLDLLVSVALSTFFPEDENEIITYYALNSGTEFDPDFIGWFSFPYGIEQDSILQISVSGDIDLDGDVDLINLVLSDTIKIEVNENMAATGAKPLFQNPTQSPYGLPTPTHEDDVYLFPALVDIDGDGDLDIFFPHILTEYMDEDEEEEVVYTTLDYYENKLCDPDETTIHEDICSGEIYTFEGTDYDQSGEYHIEDVSENACISVTHLYLTVYPDTTIIIDEELCRGEILLINDMELSETGTYEFNLLNKYGCDSTILVYLMITDINIDVEQNGSVLTAHSQADYHYQWFDCDTQINIENATSNVLDVPYSGSFAVQIINDIGCEEKSTCFDVIASRDFEVILNKQITIYPNPSQGKFRVFNESIQVIKSVEIFDLNGKSLKFYNKDFKDEFELKDFEKGIFLLKLDLGDVSIVKKLLIS